LADGIDAFAGFGFDADLCGLEAEGAGNFPPQERNVGRKLGALEADRGVHIHNRVAGLLEEFSRVTKKQEAGSVAPLRGGIRKVPANVAQRRGAEQGVADGVRQRVAVRVAHGSFVERNTHAAQNQFAPRSEAVNIAAEADPERFVICDL